MFYLIFAWANGRVNNRNAGDLRSHRAHYDVIVMMSETSDNALCSWTSVPTGVEGSIVDANAVCSRFLLFAGLHPELIGRTRCEVINDDIEGLYS